MEPFQLVNADLKELLFPFQSSNYLLQYRFGAAK